MHRHGRSWLLQFCRFLACLALVTSLWGCSGPITWQALQARGLDTKVTTSCIRPPPFAGRGEFYATNEATHEMVSDEDAEAFWKAARNATTIHRYDPNAPSEPGPRLPWPYHRLTCEEVSSGNVPALPKGMKEIPISREMREALVSVLIKRELRQGPVGHWMERGNPNRTLLGQVLITPPNLEQYTSAIDEVGQMLRDAIRSHLPMVKRAGAGPNDDKISIIDTKTGQVLGGFGTGLGLSLAPGGVLIAEGLKSGDMPKPTREFMLSEGFGEMAGGGLQLGVGTTMGAAGAGLSLAPGGAVVGVPTCAAGVALAANGAVTFLHGANTVLVALCHWEELPAAPEAASSMDTPPAATNVETPPSAGNGGSAVKPAINTAAHSPAPTPAIARAKKPASAPIATQAKPAPTTAPPAIIEAPPPGTTVVHKSASGSTTSTRRRLAPGEKPPPETTTITITEGGGTTISTTRTRQAPGDVANGVAKGAKRGQKTDPDAPHNAARRKDAETLKAEGNRIIAGGGDDKEMLVQTPGGIKSARRPDTILLTPKGERRGRNYGRTNADGTPVKREQEALDDLNNHSDTPTDFVPYDR